VGASPDTRSPGNPLNAHSDLLFGHNVLLSRYFRANSNKCSNKN
jgi:hypothetical protein